jgi:hypothetical protein
MSDIQILNYGGGQATVAACVLVAQGKLPRPNRIVIADTGREKTSTWDYLTEVMEPFLAHYGLKVEIAPRSLAYVDLYSHQGTLLIPVYTPTGKFSAYCSGEWKASVVTRYLRQQGIKSHTSWIGFTLDEQRRIKSHEGRKYPLVDLMLTKQDCKNIITDAGLPMPYPSACWMCPNQRDSEWRDVRDNYPDDWEAACQLDEAIREEDIASGRDGVWLHKSRVPLREADLDQPDEDYADRQCGLGMCMI